MERFTERQLEGHRKTAEAARKRWQDKAYRKKIEEKQRLLGLRGWTDFYYSKRV